MVLSLNASFCKTWQRKTVMTEFQQDVRNTAYFSYFKILLLIFSKNQIIELELLINQLERLDLTMFTTESSLSFQTP